MKKGRRANIHACYSSHIHYHNTCPPSSSLTSVRHLHQLTFLPIVPSQPLWGVCLCAAALVGVLRLCWGHQHITARKRYSSARINARVELFCCLG